MSSKGTSLLTVNALTLPSGLDTAKLTQGGLYTPPDLGANESVLLGALLLTQILSFSVVRFWPIGTWRCEEETRFHAGNCAGGEPTDRMVLPPSRGLVPQLFGLGAPLRMSSVDRRQRIAPGGIPGLSVRWVSATGVRCMRHLFCLCSWPPQCNVVQPNRSAWKGHETCL